MIDLDELQAAINRCEFDGDVLGLSKAECSDLLGRLRQAEKDAARYRELRDAESETCLEFINAKERAASPEWLDGLVDEYMKCSN